MLTKLQIFFHTYLSDTNDNEDMLEHKLQLASATLLVEMSCADENITCEEENKIKQLLNERFQLSTAELKSLIQLANDKQYEATDYFEFTSLLNNHYTQAKKISLVEDLWSIAYSDNNLDKFEEHLLRRLSELLHVPHQDFIRTKHKALKKSKTD